MFFLPLFLLFSLLVLLVFLVVLSSCCSWPGSCPGPPPLLLGFWGPFSGLLFWSLFLLFSLLLILQVCLCLCVWESAKVSHKRVFALLTPEIHSCEMAQMLQKPVFALPGCQRMSVNTLLCDTLALAECLFFP